MKLSFRGVISVSASECATWLNRVCEPVALTQTVLELLAKVLGNGPTAVAHCLEAALHGLDMSFDDGCRLEATLFGVGAGSAEMKEGTSAFLEKRKPSFRRQ